MSCLRLQRGVTLIELVVSITIIAIAVTIVMGTLVASTKSSAEMMNRKQAALIANSYLQEALSQAFAVGLGNTRANFDDVLDYNGLTNVGAKDRRDVSVPGLAGYIINIKAKGTALATVNALNSILVTVTVTDPDGYTYLISGYRTNHM